jgi:hypothetical protein
MHSDETKIKLKGDSGFVWVLTNMEEVVYLYKPTREVDFLREMLEGFEGTLITDFYTGYDSMPCRQQKCLVHLIRDLNTDILKHPFDVELIGIGERFGSLMQEIVATVDKFGLKARYLRKHGKRTKQWLDGLEGQAFASDIAEKYRKRLVKYREKIFLFLEQDGIPCNNNNAEHAIKPFAKYRRLVDGQISQRGLEDYLVLLSIQQTCVYKGVRFLDFLLSNEMDIDVFSEKGRREGCNV